MDMPGFYFCVCPDPSLARDHIEAQSATFASPVSGVSSESGAPPVETHVWWADDGLDSRFWEALTLQGLTQTPRILLVRGAQLLPAEVWKKLSAALASPRPGTLPVFFLENSWEKGQPKLPAHITRLKCLEFAGKKNWVWRSPGLTLNTLRRHVQERAAPLGLGFEAGALEALCESLPLDAASVQGVLAQLALAAPESPASARLVSVELARRLTAHTPEVLIFDFLRFLQEGNTSAVWNTLLAEGDGGEAMLFPLLGLLAREARTLWQVHAGEDVWLPHQAAGAKRALAVRLGKSGLSRIFSCVMEAEWAVKSGRRQPLQALEELVAELTLIFKARQGSTV